MRALGIWLWCLVAHCAVADTAQAPDSNRYDRIVAAVTEAEQEEVERFAAIAVQQLVEVYIAEADLARSQAQDSDRESKLLAWSRSVEQYIEHLLTVIDSIEGNAEIHLLLRDMQPPAIRSAGVTVVLSHPRPDQQGAYQQRVLSHYCRAGFCDRWLAVEKPPRPIPMTAAAPQPVWRFDSDGPQCSARGITLSFSGQGNLALRRGLCVQLVQELLSLANELQWQQAQGVAIDLAALVIEPVVHSPEHQVRLNAGGDLVLVVLPLLASTEGLLAAVENWLHAELTGSDISLNLHAEQFGW